MADQEEFIHGIKHRFSLHNASLQGRHARIRNESFAPDSKVYVESASGPFLFGMDGRRYIDLVLGGGAILLGHASEIIVKAADDALRNGTIFIQPHLVGEELAETILDCLPPHLGGIAFCSSGTEATIRAIRLARAFTGKDKIAIFSGGWHGSHDYVLIGEDYRESKNGEPSPELASLGIPQSIKDSCLLLPYNHDMAFDMIERHRNELAMVLAEPVQGSNPRDDIAPFLAKLRTVTKENLVLLGFDEIITGFRLGLGGAQKEFGVDADLVMLGKAVGGGFPLAAVAGRSEIMDKIKDGVFMGGTFSANPFSCAVSLALLRHLRGSREEVYPPLETHGRLLKNTVNDFCEANAIPVRMWGMKSFLRLIFTDQHIRSRRDRDEKECPQSVQKLFYMELANRGVMASSNRILFLSTSHDTAIVQQTACVINDLLSEFHFHGLLGQHGDMKSIRVNEKAL